MKKEKYRIEYILNHVSHSCLWNLLSTGSGLEDWFADRVTIERNIYYTFYWNKEGQDARAVLIRPGCSIRFKWKDEPDPRAYFEFAICYMELTGSTSLEITDFAEPDEKSDAIDLWDSQVATLKRKLGV